MPGFLAISYSCLYSLTKEEPKSYQKATNSADFIRKQGNKGLLLLKKKKRNEQRNPVLCLFNFLLVLFFAGMEKILPGMCF